MYEIILTLHSYWAYLVLIILILSSGNALFKSITGKEYSAKDFRISLFTLIVSHIQLLIGLILYFVSPKFGWWSEFGGKVMSDSTMRLYLVEHPTINIIAVALITIGYSKHKKKLTSKSKLKLIAIFYPIALLLFLSRIPWAVWLS